jgi:hypothetical protein
MARLVRFLDLFLAVIAFGLLVFSFLLVGLAVKKSLLMEKSHVSNHRLNDRSDSTEPNDDVMNTPCPECNP